MSCDACERARADKASGLYHADCPECQARGLSHSQVYWRACGLGLITRDYRTALESITQPAEHFEACHRRVRAWADHHAGTDE